jgi:hypothetical protein
LLWLEVEEDLVRLDGPQRSKVVGLRKAKWAKMNFIQRKFEVQTKDILEFKPRF